MNTSINALLSGWEWRVEVLLVALVLGGLYVRGWLTLRQKGHLLGRGWRLACYVAGWLAVIIALLSPIDRLGGLLFWVHMAQHLLLIMVAPPLLWLAAPFPVGLWGMPAQARQLSATLLNRRSKARRFLRVAGAPGVVWLIFVTLLFAWHDPAAYNAALRSEWVHDAEHLSFFAIGMLYWWQMIGAAPIFSKRLTMPQRFIYAISAVPPNMVVGATLALASEPTYSHYLTVPRISTLTVMEDLHFGGLIMWIPGSMMYILAGIVALRFVLGGDSD